MKCGWKKCSLLLFSALLFGLLIAKGFAEAGGNAKRPLDFSSFVVVGDSLSAGSENFSLDEDFQPHGYAALVARQAGAVFPLPLIARPGIPPALTLLRPGPLPVLGQEPGESIGRIDPFLQPFNVSVPNLKIDEVLESRPDCVIDPLAGGIRLTDVYTELVLGFPACLIGGLHLSEIETAEALHPTFVILWVGNNDTLWASVLGVMSEITPLETFSPAYEAIVKRMVATGAKLVIGNLPDPTAAPLLIPAGKVAALLDKDVAVLGPILGIQAGDFVTPFALEAIGKILTGVIPGPLPDNLVVTAAEIKIIKAANEQFNQVVFQVAARYNIPVADIRGLLNKIGKNGIVVGGQRLTTDYLGGIFSLDGFHPTNTGYAITANEFIKTINQFYGTMIPRVNLEEVMQTDPLIFP